MLIKLLIHLAVWKGINLLINLKLKPSLKTVRSIYLQVKTGYCEN